MPLLARADELICPGDVISFDIGRPEPEPPKFVPSQPLRRVVSLIVSATEIVSALAHLVVAPIARRGDRDIDRGLDDLAPLS